MQAIRPFPAILLNTAQDNLAAIPAPPYDTLSVEQARDYAKGNPLSFLHLTRPEIDLAEGGDPYSQAVYDKGAENFQHFLNDGMLQSDQDSRYYVYRITQGGHIQTGLAAAISVRALQQNWLRRHEFTRPEKVTDRLQLMQAQQANLSPVLLAYRHQSTIAQLLQQVTQNPALYSVEMAGGSVHSLWRVDDSMLIETISEQFNALPAVYIADGHHRCACAEAYAEHCVQQGSHDDALNQYLLAVLFADSELHILSYNRVLRDLNGMSAEELLERLQQSITVEKSDKAIEPLVPNEIGMYLAGHWYRLKFPQLSLTERPVSLLHEQVIEPLFNVIDPRCDKRIDFIGGEHSVSQIEQRVASGEAAVGFSLYPTTMDQLLTVADNQQVMPPKSTWFEPKLADGLLGMVTKCLVYRC